MMFEFVIGVADCVPLDPFPGVRMSTTEAKRMTLSVVDLEPHAVIPEHSHPHEQIGYCVEGEFDFIIGGKTYHIVPGHIWRIPGGVLHKVIAGDRRARAIDVFYPVREDMRRQAE
jgi:quercetin dioxygenase-like cupin family protein